MTTIQLADATKTRLDGLKPRGVTYDQLVRWMLDAHPDPDWAEELAARTAWEPRIVEARRLRMENARSVTRAPAEQVTLSDVAAERFRLWCDVGRIVKKEARRWHVNLSREEVPPVRIRRAPEST